MTLSNSSWLAGAFALAFFGSIATHQAAAGETPAPEGALVSIANLHDGDEVASPVTVMFIIEGMDVVPAGTEQANSGHHHLLIDRPPFGQGEEDDLDNPLPADEHHVHFGKGQIETIVELAPGPHTLQLVLGDHNHIPHNPPVASEVITITVN